MPFIDNPVGFFYVFNILQQAGRDHALEGAIRALIHAPITVPQDSRVRLDGGNAVHHVGFKDGIK